jgi:hypothetical protein
MNRTDSTISADRWIRRGTAAAVLLVATIAAVISYGHIQSLAVGWGQTRLAAALMPLSIDGTVVAASLVMLRAARLRVETPWLARVMLGLAVVSTVAANVAYGQPHGTGAAILSGLPAVLFVGCAEMAILMVRRARPAASLSASIPTTAWQPPKLRDIQTAEGVSSRTAQTIRRREIAAVKAASNGHGGR